MTLAPALILAALAGAPAATPAAAPAPASAAPKGARVGRPPLPKASLPTVEGEVVEIDHRAHRVRIRASSGELVLSFDRDTLVRGPSGAATPLLITPGRKLKVGRDGDARAAWVELGAVPPTPRPTP